jgi:hypothetical protein
MNFYKWLAVIGGVLVVSGLLTAFISGHYSERVMSEARKEVPIDADSPDGCKNETLLWWADFWFYVGLVITAIGGLLLGAVLPLASAYPDR